MKLISETILSGYFYSEEILPFYSRNTPSRLERGFDEDQTKQETQPSKWTMR